MHMANYTKTYGPKQSWQKKNAKGNLAQITRKKCTFPFALKC